MHVVLLGLMGAGKTSIGKRVAARLGMPLVDGDVWLEERTGGRTAAEVAAEAGIESLHDLEAQVALDALAEPAPSVIGPAASVIEAPAVLEAMAAHLVVWLRAEATYLADRAVRKDHRPLLDDGDPVALFEGQLARREPLVLGVADLVIDVGTTAKDDAADRIAALARQRAVTPSSSSPSSPPS